LCEEQGARNACIARLSGGNFAVLLGDIAEPAAADISARLKLTLTQDPMIAKDGQGVHAGFAVYRGQSLSEYIGEASWSLCYAQIAAATKDRRSIPVTSPLNVHPEKGA
jgi:GGDEF domain-containing protein